MSILDSMETSLTQLRSDARFSEAVFAEMKAHRDTLAPPAVSDIDLLRFQLARGSADAAIANLTETRAWRASLAGMDGSCGTCEGDPHSHSFQVIGVDAHGRPIVYGCPARAAVRDVDACVQHVVRSLEHAFAQPGTHHTWVWAVDYAGFGIVHAMQVPLALSFATTFSRHMPERLGKILLINAPFAWRALLSALTPVLDERTRGKLVSVTGAPSEVGAQLRTVHGFNDVTATWMERTLGMEAKPGSLPPLHPSWRVFTLPGLVPKYAWASEEETQPRA